MKVAEKRVRMEVFTRWEGSGTEADQGGTQREEGNQLKRIHGIVTGFLQGGSAEDSERESQFKLRKSFFLLDNLRDILDVSLPEPLPFLSRMLMRIN